MMCTSQGQLFAFISISWLTVSAHFPGDFALQSSIWAELHPACWKRAPLTVCLSMQRSHSKYGNTTARSNSRRPAHIILVEGGSCLMEGGQQMCSACASVDIQGNFYMEYSQPALWCDCWCLLMLHNTCKRRNKWVFVEWKLKCAYLSCLQ